MKILYAGHGIIGATGLCHLFSENNYSPSDITLLYEPKDKSPESLIIRNYANVYAVPIYTAEEISEKSFNFDLLISVHWKNRINYNLINLAKFGGINLHPSLLPKYAGCSSLAWALINNEKLVGYSWHIMETEFDTGDIILQKTMPVKENDTAFSLWNRVNLEGVKSLKEVIPLAISDSTTKVKQNMKNRTYYKRGFPTYQECLKVNPNLSLKEYKNASYFPNKTS